MGSLYSSFFWIAVIDDNLPESYFKTLNLKKMRKTFLVIVLISFLGCTPNKKTIDIETIVFSPLKKIGQINDSTFLSLVLNITENNGFVYFSDSKNNRIVCVDSNYRLVQCFGASGRGPSEFNFTGGTMVNNNKLYAIDENNKRINIF